MGDTPNHVVSAPDLRALTASVFRAVGCDDAEAGRIARYLVEANLTGHDSHGVIRVPRYVEDVRTARTIVGRSVSILAESPTHAVLDGNYGFGQSIGPEAVGIGIAKAKLSGLSVIALRHSAHLGRIGDWGELAAESGLVAIHYVNVGNSLLVAPYGGRDRRFATNPICIAIPPLAGRPMLLLDLATAVVAEGKVMIAANGGKPIPEAALIGPDGALSSDPIKLYGPKVPGRPFSARHGIGAIRAFGEHKGSAFSFMCEILAGLLTGSGTAGPEDPRTDRVCNGMLSFYLDPEHFGARDFALRTMEFADYVKSSATAAGTEEVLVPGETEARTRAQRQAHGIPLQEETWTAFGRVADSLGVALPA